MVTNTRCDTFSRTALLRDRCLKRKHLAWADTRLVTAASLRDSEEEPAWLIRKARCTRDRLAAVRFALDECEILVGRLAPRPEDARDAALAEAGAYLAGYTWPSGQTGHCELDRSRVFSEGIGALLADVRQREANGEEDQATVYRAFALALEGFARFIERAAETAETAAAGAEGPRQQELLSMAASCRRIAHEPPTSFHDAIQLLWLMDLAVMYGDTVGLVVPGHLDRTLRPYYEADLRAGRITPEEALSLIEQLYLLVNEFIPDGLAMSVLVGGRDAAGADVTNALSYLCLEAIRRTGLIYPTVGICWHEGTPQDLTELAVDLIAEGFTTPAFFCDDTIQRGLQALGAPPEDACNYINSTCVEITPVAGSNVWVASPYFSLCALLMEEMGAQVNTWSPAPTFDAFLQAYRSRLAGAIAAGAGVQNALREERRLHGGKPLQSVFTRDCIARGCDIDQGGARYNWVECSFVGLANLADSLLALKGEVYDGGTPLPALKAALDADFEGHEPLRQRLVQRYAKYGNDDDVADRLVGEMVAFCSAECAKHGMTPNGAPFVPGAFCWVMHEHLGRQCGATPDGRKAGFPFADGGGPAQGREKAGPTAAVLSTTSWDHAPLIGGLAYNMKFGKALFKDPESRGRLRDLILTYLRRGGFETQVNVVDHEVLLKAREHPDAYRDLVVRIGGYCDYFVRLSPEMQEEVIQRTEFTRV